VISLEDAPDDQLREVGRRHRNVRESHVVDDD
jgi:hypothetical protein